MTGPTTFGRGLEITLTCDEAAFEGSGVFLLGSVLERFFAKYTAINSFTETVLRSVQRAEVMRWPAKPGVRPASERRARLLAERSGAGDAGERSGATAPGCFAALKSAPHEFDFFQVMRRLEQAHAGAAALRDGASARPTSRSVSASNRRWRSRRPLSRS